nr:hypothetical protein [Hungatella effluvii]
MRLRVHVTAAAGGGDYKSLLSLNMTMVSVPSEAVTGLLKVKLNAVSVGTSIINDTEPNALDCPELVMK